MNLLFFIAAGLACVALIQLQTAKNHIASLRASLDGAWREIQRLRLRFEQADLSQNSVMPPAETADPISPEPNPNAAPPLIEATAAAQPISATAVLKSIENARANAPTPPLESQNAPPAIPDYLQPATLPSAGGFTQPARNWERFIGAKLIAWIGGLALFLGIAFFIKYSFDNNLIPPAMRVALGFAVGSILVFTGLRLRQKRAVVTSQTLCATGLVVLYAAAFAAHGYYNLIGLGLAFFLLAGFSTAALFLALRLDAAVVAVLGLLAGFLTPVLLSSGADRPTALFTYIGFLDLSLFAVLWFRPWHYLPMLAAIGTALFELAWFVQFGTPNSPLRLFVIFQAFNFLFLAGVLVAENIHGKNVSLSASAIVLPVLSLAISLSLALTCRDHPGFILSFVFATDFCLLSFHLGNRTVPLLPKLASAWTLAILSLWIANSVDRNTIPWVFGGTALYAFLHLGTALLDQRRQTSEPSPSRLASAFRSANLIAAAATPFFLLLLTETRVRLPSPLPTFTAAAVLVLALIGLSTWLDSRLLWPTALAGVLAVEIEWHLSFFTARNPAAPLVWYLFFYALFTIAPFALRSKLMPKTLPWITAALAGPLHFFLIHDAVITAFPTPVPGLIPALMALPMAAAFSTVKQSWPADHPHRLQLLAWFGGSALWFVTLVFPIQFQHEWLTVAWAAEGAALLWLFCRIPHPGLRLAGSTLLAIAFFRLMFNPAVLVYHQRSGFPLLNWYLYAYGTVAILLLASARFAAPPRHQLGRISLPMLFYALSAALLFALLNLEIADYFGEGSTLRFEFSGSFSRDLAYSIGWAVFAFALLLTGIWKRAPAARYASLGLFSITIIKLFFHDLSQLAKLYQISAFIGVALVLICASYFYQRFLSLDTPDRQPKPLLQSSAPAPK